MSRLALIRDGVVVNVIEASIAFALAVPGTELVVPSEHAGIGWLLVEGELVAPVVAPAPTPAEVLTPLAFLRRFSIEEMATVLASPDPLIAPFVIMLQVAQEVSVEDPATIAFVQYAAQLGLISAERAAQILTVA